MILAASCWQSTTATEQQLMIRFQLLLQLLVLLHVSVAKVAAGSVRMLAETGLFRL